MKKIALLYFCFILYSSPVFAGCFPKDTLSDVIKQAQSGQPVIATPSQIPMNSTCPRDTLKETIESAPKSNQSNNTANKVNNAINQMNVIKNTASSVINY